MNGFKLYKFINLLVATDYIKKPYPLQGFKHKYTNLDEPYFFRKVREVSR